MSDQQRPDPEGYFEFEGYGGPCLMDDPSTNPSNWLKFVSSRRSRPCYYFNRVTHEKRWNPPHFRRGSTLNQIQIFKRDDETSSISSDQDYIPTTTVTVSTNHQGRTENRDSMESGIGTGTSLMSNSMSEPGCGSVSFWKKTVPTSVEIPWKLFTVSLGENRCNTRSLLDHHSPLLSKKDKICNCDNKIVIYDYEHHSSTSNMNRNVTKSENTAGADIDSEMCSPRLSVQSKPLHMNYSMCSEASAQGKTEKNNISSRILSLSSNETGELKATGARNGPAEIRMNNFKEKLAADGKQSASQHPKKQNTAAEVPSRRHSAYHAVQNEQHYLPSSGSQHRHRQTSGNAYGVSRTKAADRLNALQTRLATLPETTGARSGSSSASLSSHSFTSTTSQNSLKDSEQCIARSTRPTSNDPPSQVNQQVPSATVTSSSAKSTTYLTAESTSRPSKRKSCPNSLSFDTAANKDERKKIRLDLSHTDTTFSTAEPNAASTLSAVHTESNSLPTEVPIKPRFVNENTFKRRYTSIPPTRSSKPIVEMPSTTGHKTAQIDVSKKVQIQVDTTRVSTAPRNSSTKSGDVHAKDSPQCRYTSPVPQEFMEDMEWEPSEVQIQEFVSVVHDVREMLTDSDINFPDDVSTKPSTIKSSKGYKFMFVIDTNVLMGHLKFVEYLRDRSHAGLEPMVLIIPWTVLQELDKIKDMGPGMRRKLPLPQAQARQACNWVNKQLASNHPRVKCQSAFTSSMAYVCKNGDDSILKCCLQMQEFANNVTLLSEDVNFRSKAISKKVQAKSRIEVEAALQRLQNENTKKPSSVDNDTSGHSSNASQNDPNWYLNELDIPSYKDTEIAEKIICTAKDALKEFLDEVVMKSMQEAYGNGWLKIVEIKPPWVILNDLIKNILVHWKTVFADVFSSSKDDITYIDKFIGPANKKSYNFSLQEANDFVSACIRLCNLKLLNSFKDPCHIALKRLQTLLICSEPSEKSHPLDITSSDAKVILEPLERIWMSLSSVCNAGCNTYNIAMTVPNVNPIIELNNSDRVQWNSFLTQVNFLYSVVPPLLDNLTRVMAVPREELHTSHADMLNLRYILIQISLEYEVVDDFPPMESLLGFMLSDEYRLKVENGIQQLSNFLSILRQIVQNTKQL